MSVIGRVAPFLMPAPSSKFRYLRLLVTKINASTYSVITEIYWKSGGSDYPTAAMTSASAPSPLAVTTSSDYALGFAGWHAFDRDLGQYWSPSGGAFPSQTGNEWITVDLGAGNEISPSGIGIVPYSGVSSYTPVDFSCYGSNTGSFTGEETLLYSATGLTTGWSGSTRRDFTF